MHTAWEELQASYVTYLAGHGRSKDTIRSYLSDLQQFTQYCLVHDIALDITQVSYDDVMMYLAEQRRKWSAATLERRRTSLVGWMKYLALEHTVPALSLILADRLAPTAKSPTLPVYLSKIETLQFIRALQRPVYSVNTMLTYRDHALFRVMLTTGMRISEILGLSVEAVETALSTKEFRILGKGSKERIIPVHPDLQGPLTVWLLNRPDSLNTACFMTRRGLPMKPRDAQRVIKRYAEAAGIKKHVTPHTLRHTFATLLLDANVNLRLIQRLLGHSSLAITERYTHIQTAGLHEAIRALSLSDDTEKS